MAPALLHTFKSRLHFQLPHSFIFLTAQYDRHCWYGLFRDSEAMKIKQLYWLTQCHFLGHMMYPSYGKCNRLPYQAQYDVYENHPN